MSNKNLEQTLDSQKNELLNYLDKEELNRKAFIDGIKTAFSAVFDQLFK